MQSKINICMANSIDPDETAHDEPSHLDLYCLRRYLYWSAGMNFNFMCGALNNIVGNCKRILLVLGCYVLSIMQLLKC